MEDIHLVFLYNSTSKWGNLESKRSNRFYLNHDISNANFETMDAFHKKSTKFKPSIVVASGV